MALFTKSVDEIMGVFTKTVTELEKCGFECEGKADKHRADAYEAKKKADDLQREATSAFQLRDRIAALVA